MMVKIKESDPMDKVYIDGQTKTEKVDLPTHGTVKLIVQDGRVIRTETTISKKLK
ncbi:hypothetical protein D922_00862 [Enterococcus faecalis 06-MB-DW-09]|nr:hypothetical protein D922_00862 [Enterococcus faecalis 06-MB-DW-09]